MGAGIIFTALQGMPDLRAGDDLAALLAAAMPADAASGEVQVQIQIQILVARKIVFKAEDLFR